jgi:hypothetical protein
VAFESRPMQWSALPEGKQKNELALPHENHENK